MEPLYVSPQGDNNPSLSLTVVPKTNISTPKPFIEANTIEASLDEIKEQHIIPVFSKSNQPLISHSDFIEAAQDAVNKLFPSERILSPCIRLSHAVKGRTPEARNKPVNELQDWEKTLWYERMMFVIEIPSISDTVGDETLSLTIGGVKCYNEDNLTSGKAKQHFKMFIGFKISICSNLSIWGDGLVESVDAGSLQELHFMVSHMVQTFDAITNLKVLTNLQLFKLREQEFANLIGRCKMYQHLPLAVKQDIPSLLFGDNQINMICRDYFKDSSFCRSSDGDINLWKLLNLLTSINKGSYIDTFLMRAANASHFVGELAYDIGNGKKNWFLS